MSRILKRRKRANNEKCHTTPISVYDDDTIISDDNIEIFDEVIFAPAIGEITSELDEPSTNPATGLTMCGAVDTGGNPFGFDNDLHQIETDDLYHDSVIDTSFDDTCSFDDIGGFDDW